MGAIGAVGAISAVGAALFGFAPPAGAAASEWQLYVIASGQRVAVYQSFDACSQAAATSARAPLACKPLPDIVPGEAPTPVVVQPTAQIAPGMNGAFQIDASNLPHGTTAYNVDRIAPTDEVPSYVEISAFRTVCDFSHMAFDDPIVYPGQPGAAHLHAFFGNTATNANSTVESIANSGNSTCRGGTSNRTAYWVPAMIDTATGKPIPPDVGNFYYKQGFLVGPSSQTQPMPSGLRMIAGNPTSSTPTDAAHTFKCAGGPNSSNDQYGKGIPNCDAGAQVVQEIYFPQCWDGSNLDSPDHKSHMSYPVQLQQAPFTWSCPATHPVILPQVTFVIGYTVPRAGASRSWRLASDTYDVNLPAGYSSHGDWFNGWRKDISDTWLLGCVRANRDCHSHLLGDGRMIY